MPVITGKEGSQTLSPDAANGATVVTQTLDDFYADLEANVLQDLFAGGLGLPRGR